LPLPLPFPIPPLPSPFPLPLFPLPLFALFPLLVDEGLVAGEAGELVGELAGLLLVSAMMVVVSFFASMMVVYGKKTMPLQFAALMVMTLSMENQVPIADAFLHAALFLGGGLGYLAYSMAVSWFLRRRIKQRPITPLQFHDEPVLRPLPGGQAGQHLMEFGSYVEGVMKSGGVGGGLTGG